MKIKNRNSGDIKEVSQKEWENIQANPLLKGWFAIDKVAAPPEVAEIAAKNETAKDEAEKTEKSKPSK